MVSNRMKWSECTTKYSTDIRQIGKCIFHFKFNWKFFNEKGFSWFSSSFFSLSSNLETCNAILICPSSLIQPIEMGWSGNQSDWLIWSTYRYPWWRSYPALELTNETTQPNQMYGNFVWATYEEREVKKKLINYNIMMADSGKSGKLKKTKHWIRSIKETERKGGIEALEG